MKTSQICEGVVNINFVNTMKVENVEQVLLNTLKIMAIIKSRCKHKQHVSCKQFPIPSNFCFWLAVLDTTTAAATPVLLLEAMDK